MNDEPFFCTAGVVVPRDVTRLVIGGVTVVEARMFMHCINLVRVEIREGVQEIGMGAFRGCRNLRLVDSPSSLRAIGNCAFHRCSSLSTMDLPEGLRRIGLMAFNGHCFERITVPSSVMEIGAGAFLRGKVLRKVTLAGTIPSSVVEIGEKAFAYCDYLEAATLTGGTVCWAGMHSLDAGNCGSSRLPWK